MMLENNHRKRLRQSFADQFEADGKDIFYRKNMKGPPVLVTQAEREAFVTTYNRRLRFAMWPIPFVNILVIGLLAWFAPDTRGTTGQWSIGLAARFPDNFGDLEPFWFATTRADAQAAFAHFLRASLPEFGPYQDAMLWGHRFLHHSVISPYLNAGLLDPLEMCRQAEAEWRTGRVPLSSAEGFIRQIIGWREFVRGIYWWQG